MLFNHLLGIYCFHCKKYCDPHTEIYLFDGEEGRICCLECDNLVGFTWDKTWVEFWKEDCPYYYLYHNKGICRCIQDNSNCFGNEEKCCFYLGKQSYLEDLKENEK